MCIASVRKTFLEYEINVITDDNINSFIEFPEYVSKNIKMVTLQERIIRI